MRKNSCITDQIQEERQVSFMCHIRELYNFLVMCDI